MRRIFTWLRLQTNAPQPTLVIGLQFDKRRRRRDLGDDRARLVGAEPAQLFKGDRERRTPDFAENLDNFARRPLVNIADEA